MPLLWLPISYATARCPTKMHLISSSANEPASIPTRHLFRPFKNGSHLSKDRRWLDGSHLDETTVPLFSFIRPWFRRTSFCYLCITCVLRLFTILYHSTIDVFNYNSKFRSFSRGSVTFCNTCDIPFLIAPTPHVRRLSCHRRN